MDIALQTSKFIEKHTKNDKTHRAHGPKFQGRVFSEVGEAPQAR